MSPRKRKIEANIIGVGGVWEPAAMGLQQIRI
jgi:hypothetical protein